MLQLPKLILVHDWRFIGQSLRGHRVVQRPDDPLRDRIVRHPGHFVDRDSGTSAKWILSNAYPFDQCLREEPVAVPPVIEDRFDVLRTPTVPHLRLAGFGTVRVRECVGRLDARPLRPFGGERVDHVAHHGITDAVANEDHGELTEQFGDESRRPPLGQVRATEVRRSEHEVRAILVSCNTAVQVDQARPGVGFRHGQLRRRIHLLIRTCFEKPVVEIGGDEPKALLVLRQIDQCLMDV